MSWLGNGPPKFTVNGTSYTFPRPVEDGRSDELFVAEVAESWVNIDGDLVEGEWKFRLEEELTWVSLSAVQIELLAQWLTSRAVVGFQPHDDVSRVYPCRLYSFKNPRGIVTAAREEITVTVRSIGLLDAMPARSLGVIGRLKQGSL